MQLLGVEEKSRSRFKGFGPLWARIGAALAMALCLAGAHGTWAQGGPKIGFVDVDLASARSQTVQKVVKAAENDQKKRQDGLDVQMREYRQRQTDLAARRSVLSDPEVKREEQKLEAMRDDLEIKRLEIEKQWRRITTEVMEPAVNRIMESVQRVAKSRGYDLVLRRDVVLYGVDALDITALVVQELDGGAAPAATKPASPALPPPGSEEPKKPADDGKKKK